MSLRALAAIAILTLACTAVFLPSCWARGRDQRQNQPRNNPPHPGNVPRPGEHYPNHNPGAVRPQNIAPPPERNQPSRHAGEWLRQYKSMPADQQRRALDSDPQFRQLPPERQQRLRDRLQRFNNMPPQQQQRVLNRMEVWEHLTPAQKQDARRVFGEIRALPPDRRNAMQNAINAMRAMPPDARRKALESGRFSQYSPQERELLKGVTELPLAPESQPNPNVPRP